MLNYKVKIGLVAMRRNTTDRPRGTFLTWYSAEQRGKRFTEYIEKNFSGENVEFVDNKGIGIADLVFDNESAAQVIERFKAEKVDAVMIINCNFGNEEAAADIAREMGVPTLLWAPLDDEYYVDGMRPTDSQCGLFGVSRQMQRYHIPFSHLPCCRVESPEFKEGFESFVRVACMVKNFKGMRIGQVGTRPSPFFSVICNESELLEKFNATLSPKNQRHQKEFAERAKNFLQGED
jgi:L-fucose isomerase-like protein